MKNCNCCNCCACCNSCKCYIQYLREQQIFNICRYEYDYFLNKPNVVGLGLGYKTIMGISNITPCITVFVSKKIDAGELPPEQLIPPIYKGLETDVVETGYFESQSLKGRIRPVEGGYSIGPADSKTTQGTVACLVTDGHKKYILSNNHVLADENSLQIGTPIIQPGALDAGKYPEDVVAHLSKYIPLKFESHGKRPENLVDCAMAQLVNESIAVPKIKDIGIPMGIGLVRIGMQVQKVGRTTGRTTGKIIALGTTVEVQYNKGKVLLVNQITTTDMTQGGDSGSLLLDDKKYALGLLASGSTNHSTFNLIDNVLDDLGVDIVTK